MTPQNGAAPGNASPADAHIADIAEAAAERAVQKTFLLIGIDLTDPIGAQHTFATLHDVARMAHDEEFRRDLEHIRAWRKLWENVRDKSLMAVIGLVVTAVAGALWVGFRNMVK
jgi:hypothetical protein